MSRPARRPWVRMVRLLRWVAALGVVAGAGLWIAGRVAQSALRKDNPPPGLLVDVGGYRLHLNCVGTGAPTVILDAGLMDFSTMWARVQPPVSHFTRACAYDRAGLGWSDPSPKPRTSEIMLGELRALLLAAGIEPPYVLVGHSFGGMNMRLFARRHPRDVVGLVMVDAAHEDQLLRIPELAVAGKALSNQFRSLGAVRSLGLLALAPGAIPDRGLPPVAARQYRTILAATPYFHSASVELDAMEDNFDQAHAARERELGETPMVVITRGRPNPLPSMPPAGVERLESEWREMQLRLAALSAQSTHLFAADSGHDIHLQQADLVVEAIRTVVNRARIP